ncbi:efflux RND transporter permease subunit [Fictibacillus sp. Mic-4]|uniref:efflux RND transporter permease subunit n=1 Tax=Fictibacillus sp. Mic-4 TaxID=3132826 RepID=UPI003CF8ADC7
MLHLTKFSMKNRAAIVIMVFIISIMGILSGNKLSMEFLPSLDNPVVTITTLADGMDTGSMAKSITSPLEKDLRNVKHLESIVSTTNQGISKIDLSFGVKTDMKEAKREVESIVNSFPLPDGVKKPYVVQLNTSMIPIEQIAINKEGKFTTDDQKEIEDVAISQLESIDGVGDVTLYGKSAREISIELNEKEMLAKKVTMPQIIAALKGKNISLPAGDITLNGKTNSLRVVGKMKDLNELKELPVAPHVVLKDVADVTKQQTNSSVTRVDGKEAMYIAVTKEDSGNAVQVGKDVKEKLKAINKQFDGKYHLEDIYSTSQSLYDSVMRMAKEVALGALFASVVILVFLRNFKSTIIAIVSIPLSIFITLILLEKSGITLNILTLGGLAVAVGRLVDDSIVVIENIYRRLQTGERSKELIIDSVKEVAVAITSSTITTIAVFLPIGLVEGFIGVFFKPFALTVVYSLLASLIVALTVVPLMSFVLLKKVKSHSFKKPERYLSALKWSLNHKIIVCVLCLAMFVGSIAMYVMLPTGTISSADESMVQVKMEYPEDMKFEDIKNGAFRLEDELKGLKGVETTISQVGTDEDMAQFGEAQTDNIATLTVKMKKGANADAFIKKVKSLANDYKPAQISTSKASMMGGSGSDKVTLNVTAENKKDLVPTAIELKKKMEEMKGLDKVESNYEDLKNEWRLNVDQKKAQAKGLSAEDIGNQVRALVGKTPVGQLTIGGEDLPVKISYDLSKTKDREDLLNTAIVSQTAGPVKIKDVASLKFEPAKSKEFHKDGKEYLQVSAVITGKNVKQVNTDITKMLNKLKKPSGVKVSVAGATEEMNKQFADLFQAMGVAIAIVYLVMVITFGQARAPFAILFSLPLAAVGAILGLVISKIQVDPSALIGALMLIGIVVTNAIVLIDRVQQQKAKGLSTREAILEAGAIRLRPIMMTAVATICAMIPLLFSEDNGSLVSKSLGVVVIGGLTVSTLLTLIVIPVIYEILEKLTNLFQRKRKKETVSKASV